MVTPVITSFRRSAFTPAGKGGLAGTRPDEFAAQVVRGLLSDSDMPTDAIEDLLLGCAFPEGEQGLNVARMVTFLAGLPTSVAGATVNRFCGSSMHTIHTAAGAIAMGSGDAFLCGGVESMSRIPMTGFNPMPHPGLAADWPEVFCSMGVTAENLAKEFNIARERQEEFALRSHQKAAAAQAAGKFSDEIVPIESDGGTIDDDACIRADSSLEALAALRPAFDKDGTVTAGTSSPLTDGSAFVLVCSEEFAAENGLEPLARIRSIAVGGCEPERMGIGPIEASSKALSRAGISLDDVGVIELNEAFAAQSLTVIQELGIDEARLNIDGGAIALGHPLGASGARITGKAASLLQRENARYALATMCIGGGQGIATVLEAMNGEV